MSQERERADVLDVGRCLLSTAAGCLILRDTSCCMSYYVSGQSSRREKNLTTTNLPLIRDLPHVGLSGVANKNIEYQLNLNFR